MAGSKRNKLKKAFQPSPPAPTAPADDELLDDLFAQLDSRAQVAHPNASPQILDVRAKQDPKSRFKARQVRVERIHLQRP